MCRGKPKVGPRVIQGNIWTDSGDISPRNVGLLHRQESLSGGGLEVKRISGAEENHAPGKVGWGRGPARKRQTLMTPSGGSLRALPKAQCPSKRHAPSSAKPVALVKPATGRNTAKGSSVSRACDTEGGATTRNALRFPVGKGGLSGP